LPSVRITLWMEGRLTWLEASNCIALLPRLHGDQIWHLLGLWAMSSG
jgi:hypothetical protein